MEGIRDGFVIHDDVEVASFHKVVEVFDSQEMASNSQSKCYTSAGQESASERSTEGGTVCCRSAAGGLHLQLSLRCQ